MSEVMQFRDHKIKTCGEDNEYCHKQCQFFDNLREANQFICLNPEWPGKIEKIGEGNRPERRKQCGYNARNAPSEPKTDLECHQCRYLFREGDHTKYGRWECAALDRLISSGSKLVSQPLDCPLHFKDGCMENGEFKGVPGNRSATVSEVLDMRKIPIENRVWLACHALPPKEARLFACECAEMANQNKAKVQPTSLEAIRVARLYALGRATQKELDVAYNIKYGIRNPAYVAQPNAHEAAVEAYTVALYLSDSNRKAIMARLKKIVKRLEAKSDG